MIGLIIALVICILIIIGLLYLMFGKAEQLPKKKKKEYNEVMNEKVNTNDGTLSSGGRESNPNQWND